MFNLLKNGLTADLYVIFVCKNLISL